MNNLRIPPKFLQKPSPPYFFMVHLLHRLYGVDAPGPPVLCLEQLATGDSIVLDPWRCSRICRRRVCCATLCLRRLLVTLNNMPKLNITFRSNSFNTL